MSENAGLGLAPARAAKAASERTRPWCEYAARIIAAVVMTIPTAEVCLTVGR